MFTHFSRTGPSQTDPDEVMAPFKTSSLGDRTGFVGMTGRASLVESSRHHRRHLGPGTVLRMVARMGKGL